MQAQPSFAALICDSNVAGVTGSISQDGHGRPCTQAMPSVRWMMHPGQKAVWVQVELQYLSALLSLNSAAALRSSGSR